MTPIPRSTLFTPGSEPRMMRNALETGADAITFDLEDAVAPDAKGPARAEIRRVLRETDRESGPALGVRINPLRSGGDDDLDAVVDGDRDPDYVVLPKVSRAGDVRELASELEERGSSVPIRATIETARGVLNAAAIASEEGVAGIGFGGEDLSAELGVRRVAGDELTYARQKVVLSAAAGGVPATDTVYIDVEDLAGLREVAESSRRLGFVGKSAIHPTQVPVINDVFTPTREELETAKRIVEGFDASTDGAVRIDGRMIDPPVYERARRTLERGRAAGRLD